jgi:hypothetical protein
MTLEEAASRFSENKPVQAIFKAGWSAALRKSDEVRGLVEALEGYDKLYLRISGIALADQSALNAAHENAYFALTRFREQTGRKE